MGFKRGIRKGIATLMLSAMFIGPVMAKTIMRKVIKTEFVRQYTFDNLDELNLQLFDYVNWFNNRFMRPID